MEKQTGLCSVYVMWSPGFQRQLRPCYDCHPTNFAELTDDERRTLTNKIGRYLTACRDRRAKVVKK